MSLQHWLSLSLAPLGAHRYIQRCLKEYAATELCSMSSSKLKQLGFNPAACTAISKPDQRALSEAMSWAEQDKHSIIYQTHPQYPQLLRDIPDPPLLLYIQGPAEHLTLPQVALVGSRRASPPGLSTAAHFTDALIRRGFAITSGLARGIDGACHRCAVEAGGITLAVLGSGLKQVYPNQHRRLAEEILAANGCLISEYALNARPLAYHFPWRNRIISGLSLATVVVEASVKSGSLITARLAAEQGREVFAVPGSVLNPLSAGCHALLEQGAQLASSADKISLEANNFLNFQEVACNQVTEQKELVLEKPLAMLLECVGFEDTGLDIIAERYGTQDQDFMAKLVELELMSYVKKTLNGYIRKR